MNNEQLKNRIIDANSAYRSGNAVMTDAEYDLLLEQYSKEVSEKDYLEFLNTLHEAAGKIKHPFVMGSLDKKKIQEPDTIVSFIRENVKTKLNVSAKVDGISCRLHYENGCLMSASTRGDGYFGENITDKIVYVKSIPKTINWLDAVDIRGELVILRSDFENMEGFSNPRNACAGIMNRKSTSKEFNVDEVKQITFIAYTVLGKDFSKSDQFKFLDKFGFTTTWHESFDVSVFESDEKLVSMLFECATRNLPYEIDGCVISDDQYRNEDKYRPDAQVAVKANTLAAETTLVDISWEGPGKNGFFIPVGLIEPVELGGSIISRVTCNNLDFISSLNLKYGSRIRLIKSGDIIPAIDSVIDTPAESKDIEIIQVCPCCGNTLIRDGVNMRCTNPECVDQKLYRMESFIKKLGVMNVSFKSLRSFGITSIDKLLAFNPNPAKKSETKFESELRLKLFNRSDSDIFCMMDIKDVGETLQRKIVDFYGWENVKNKNIDIPRGLPYGIGQITMDKFLESYSDNLTDLSKIISDVRYSYTESAVKNEHRKIVGSVCFTGSLNTMSRTQASKMAENAGYEVKSGVSRGLTYLVTNNVESGSSKNKKAAALGIKIIDEAEFIKITSNQIESDIMNF